MAKVSRLKNLQKGRKPEPVTESHYEHCEEITEVMATLADLKNRGDHSWRSLAEELSARSRNPISGALLRRVALGYCNSKRVERALGIVKKKRRQRPARINIDAGKERKARFDAAVEASGMAKAEFIDYLLDLNDATAPAVTHAASQSPESAAPHPRRQSASLPLR